MNLKTALTMGLKAIRKKSMSNIKLHLGCGHRHLKGFIHVDKDVLPHIDHPNTDLGDLFMFDDSSVDMIYTCGSFEYYDREEAIHVLEEWRRVLKTGGTLKISVPNFSSVVKVYQKYNDLDGIGILGPLYGKWKIHNNRFLYHKTVYDKKSLSNLLSKVGFKNIKNYVAEQFLPNGYDDYSLAYVPHMDKNGIQMQLNLECTK
jgi:predicted SAM-dependent methyltransferase